MNEPKLQDVQFVKPTLGVLCSKKPRTGGETSEVKIPEQFIREIPLISTNPKSPHALNPA
jgi:hypothetical protein